MTARSTSAPIRIERCERGSRKNATMIGIDGVKLARELSCEQIFIHDASERARRSDAPTSATERGASSGRK